MFQEIPSLKKKKQQQQQQQKNTGPLRVKKITNRSGILKTPITLLP